jgi:hypothetical protein
MYIKSLYYRIYERLFPSVKNSSSLNLIFQARWRGYFTRRQIQLEVARRLAEVRHKVEEARKNATEEKKLCNR